MPSKLHWKLVWRAPGQFTHGILKEILSKSGQSCSGMLLVNLHIGNWSVELPVNLRQFLSDFRKLVWRAPGRFACGILKETLSKSIGNWSGTLLGNSHMESLRNSFQNQWELVWREALWNSFQNQWKLVLGALGQFPNGILKEFLSISMAFCNWSGENPYGMPFKSVEINLESSWSICQWNP